MVTADPGSPERSDPAYVFDFCGGDLAIDFTNTVSYRGGDPGLRRERLATFGDVVAWAEAAGILSRQRAARLRAYASAHRDAAREEFRRALDLREGLYRVFAARARRRAPAAGDLALLNRFVADVFSRAELVASGHGFALATAGGEGLEAVLRPVVRAAVDLLTAPEVQRLGLCADETCAWLFVDATRSGTRKWCDMKGCGNRNKVRRFRASM